MSIPLASVVITSYNQPDVLPRAIESVLSQTYKNIQIVIADDGSSDGSQDLINQYAQRFPDRIKPILSPQNQGIPQNKNMGFRNCDGEFITYLDGDDFYFPEKLEREISVFESDKSLGVVYSNFAFVDEQGKLEKYWKKESICVPQGDIFEQVFSRKFPYWTIYRNELIRADVFKKINYYDERLIAYEDWDSRIRINKNTKVGYSDYVGAAYVNYPASITKVEKQERLLQEMRFVINKNKQLLTDLPLPKQWQILRSLNRELIPREIEVSSADYSRKIGLLLKYLVTTGDLKYPLKAIYGKLKS
ncbi:MAG: glycosyltransferase family 2 protein [Microcystaceae cyanobacterium]